MKRAALVVALVLMTACKGDATKLPPPSTTTTTTSTTTTSTTTTTTTVRVAQATGCDASSLPRVKPRDDITKYEVDATYEPAANQVAGELVAHFTPDRDTERVVMRMWPNGPTPAGHGGRMQLFDATLDNIPLPLTSDNPTTAAVAAPLRADKTVEFKVGFRVTLPTHSDDRLSREGNSVRLGSWMPLLPWEPGVGWALDPPTTSNAEASLSVHANFIVHLHTPPGLDVLGSGQDLGNGTWQILGAPDWAASIGDFAVAQGEAAGVPVIVGVDRAIGESAGPYLARVSASLNDLARRYGAYPWPAYRLAITPNLRGGIEYPGHVMQGPGTNTRTTPHEVAHQWFYALVGNDQGRDPWLDEALATWGEAQVDHTFNAFMQKSIPADGRGHLGEPMPYWDSRHGSYYRSVYVQGLQALGSLGVSQAAVDCALARYVAANAYRIGTPKTLTSALQTVAPNAADVLARFGAQRVS